MQIEPPGIHIEPEQAISQIAGDESLLDTKNFGPRSEALDFIDFHIIHRLDGPEAASDCRLKTLREEAERLKTKLQEIDNTMFAGLRQQIVSANHHPQQFTDMVSWHIAVDVHAINPPNLIGYDTLDLFVDGLLSTQPLPQNMAPLQPGMVFYQKTPARIVFELAARARLTPDDVFFDIGSGLGQVAILINLITGVETRGIEFDPALCRYSRQCAKCLQLKKVNFVNANALDYDYADGTVFFLYTPFKDDMLKNMLGILKAEATIRPISIFTYGPCSAVVAGENWLRCRQTLPIDIYTLYQFESLQPNKQRY